MRVCIEQEVAPVVTIPTTVVPLPSAALVTDTHGNASTTSLPAPAMDLKMLESHVSENMLMRMCRRVKNLVDTKDRTYHMKTYKNVFLGRYVQCLKCCIVIVMLYCHFV